MGARPGLQQDMPAPGREAFLALEGHQYRLWDGPKILPGDPGLPHQLSVLSHPCPPLPPKGRSLYQKSCTYSSSEARGSVWLACRRAGQVTVGGGSSRTAVFGCSQASRGSMEPRLTP